MTHCSQGPILVESTGTGTVSMRSSEHKIPFCSVPNLWEEEGGEGEGGKQERVTERERERERGRERE